MFKSPINEFASEIATGNLIDQSSNLTSFLTDES